MRCPCGNLKRCLAPWVVPGIVFFVIVGLLPCLWNWLSPDGAVVCYYRGIEFNQWRGAGHRRSIDWFAARRPHPLLPSDRFSMRWSAWLDVPETGQYTFAAGCDGGLRLWLGKHLLIDCWEEQGYVPGGMQTQLHLEAGRYPLRLDYFDAAGPARIRLEWTGPGIPPRTVVGVPYLKKRWKDP